MKYILSVLIVLFVTVPMYAQQDTVRVSMQEFIASGLENSGQIDYEYGAVELAQNRVGEARANRILPRAELNTQHGLVPGVFSQTDLPEAQYYLDPNLENDWENWAIFTRAEVSAIQPVFSFGAIDNAIQAAEYAVVAEEERFNMDRKEIELRLLDLYNSHLMLIEYMRVLDDARDTIRRIEEQLNEMIEEMNPDLDQTNVFQFNIYKARFTVQEADVTSRLGHLQRLWREVMGGTGDTLYLPMESFLEPVGFSVESFDHYYSLALTSRPEIRGVNAGIQAYQSSVDAVRAQSYPMLYLGLTASFANTPNRPRQSNPFIINNTNFLSAGIGFGIRQSLNFASIKNRINREVLQYNRVTDLKSALSDQIFIELSESYSNLIAARDAVSGIEEALTVSREWVRDEQLNADFGDANMEDLVDAVRNELELRIEYQNRVYEYNKRVAELRKAAGLSLTDETPNE